MIQKEKLVTYKELIDFGYENREKIPVFVKHYAPTGVTGSRLQSGQQWPISKCLT